MDEYLRRRVRWLLKRKRRFRWRCILLVMLEGPIIGLTWASANSSALETRTSAAAFGFPAEHRFRNCVDVRLAGRGPIFLGEADYRSILDGDNDGIACEPAIDQLF